MKRRQKAGFVSPRSFKITGKGKGEKEGARRRKGGEEKKSNGCILSFSVIATLEFLAEKNCWTQKVHLAITFSKSDLLYIRKNK